MRDPKRIDLILAKVKYIWEMNPDIRLGQLLCHCANYGALYYSEDDDLIKLLEQTYKIDTSHIQTPKIFLEASEADNAEKLEGVLKTLEIVAQENAQAKNKRTCSNKGRVYVHKKDVEKAIFPSELSEFLSEGWEKGKIKRNNF